jgi:putative nucleotidyltransferase with HDIG domain
VDKAQLLEIFPDFNEVQDQLVREKCLEAFLLGYEMGGWEEKGGLDACPVSAGEMRDDSDGNYFEHVRYTLAAAREVAEGLSPYLSELGYTLDRDLVAAGSLCHDLGKLISYDISPQGEHGTSRAGEMFCHTATGAYLAKKAGLPENLVHLVLTHSYNEAPEKGEAFETPEGVIVKFCDAISYFTIFLKWKK